MKLVYDLKPSKVKGKREFSVYNDAFPNGNRFQYVMEYTPNKAVIRRQDGCARSKCLTIPLYALPLTQDDYYKTFKHGYKRTMTSKAPSHIIAMEVRAYIEYFIKEYGGLILDRPNIEAEELAYINTPCDEF